jgi:hypothetical protein
VGRVNQLWPTARASPDEPQTLLLDPRSVEDGAQRRPQSVQRAAGAP